MKNILKYASIGILALTAVACEDQESLNVNPNAAGVVPSNMLMNGAEKWTVDNIYDNWFSARQCLVYSQQWSQRNYTEEDRYQIRESTNNSYFKYLYMGLNNFQRVIDMNTNPETAAKNEVYGANCNQIAAAMIMKVWLAQVMTDTWGSIPYSSALNLEKGDAVYSKYDNQKDLYNQLINELTEAVEMIDESEPAFISGDVIYDGDASKWKKFGNSLKCRLAIHIAKVDDKWRTYIQEALQSGVMESNEDAAKFQYSTTGSEYCKFYEGFYIDGRNDFTINKVLVDLLKGQRDTLNAKTHPWEGVIDPRLYVYTTPTQIEINGTKVDVYNGLPVATQNGIQSNIWTADNCSKWYQQHPPVLNKDYAVPLMTYAELKFIIGEYNNFSADDYKEGVRASVEYWYDVMGKSISNAEIETYVNAVSQNINEEAYAIQKYLDLFTNGTEAWVEIRRTGYPEQIVRPGENSGVLKGTIYKFEPLSDTKGDIISRVKYPTDESTLNGAFWEEAVSNLQDKTNNYYTKMFWDVRRSTYDHPANK